MAGNVFLKFGIVSTIIHIHMYVAIAFAVRGCMVCTSYSAACPLICNDLFCSVVRQTIFISPIFPVLKWLD